MILSRYSPSVMPSARAATLAERTVRLARLATSSRPGSGRPVWQQDGQALSVLVKQGPDDGHGGQAGFSGH